MLILMIISPPFLDIFTLFSRRFSLTHAIIATALLRGAICERYADTMVTMLLYDDAVIYYYAVTPALR